ncbi:hypothetical protein BDN70DRAFT_887551 [Pholiota conissans]|uniref:Uncharacterized protein n=1 Tax=Pholiota conissans TaxID=109636 RepID=A0A9P5YQP6_9AGAR|nr:hypothetical protein BDN70DRAFT_887551 [Pholiota conissans]
MRLPYPKTWQWDVPFRPLHPEPSRATRSPNVDGQNEVVANTYPSEELPHPPQPAPIELPLLSPSPKSPPALNPYVAHHLRLVSGLNTPIHWNMTLPPSSANLALSLDHHRARWSHEAAVKPRGTDPKPETMLICVEGIDQLVVAHSYKQGRSIRIIEVMQAVYRAIRRMASKSLCKCPDCDRNVVTYGSPWEHELAVDSDLAAKVIRSHFGGDFWWDGLRESAERDVWILEVRWSQTSE